MGARVVVAIPSHDSAPFPFAVDLANLAFFTVATGLREIDTFGIVGITSTVIHHARNGLLRRCMGQTPTPTHVLWLDSDMRFPRDALLRLLQHDVDMVGINYVRRELPTQFTAYKRVAADGEVSEHCVTAPDSTGLEMVDAVGLGLCLMKTEILARLPDPDAEPWFQFPWLPKLRLMQGEDVHFCSLLRDHGVRVYVDHDLSKACAHIGSFEYKLELMLGQTEATGVV